jgi:succinate dehydrogenase / fumarate reductase, iron-sulfur subunit
MRLTFSIQRFNPEIDKHPHEEDYRLEVGRGMTVLDGLIRIQNEQDGALSFRYSCRSAICGSCAMTINGHEKLACRTSVRKELERHGRIRIAPLRNLSIIKDLVVDMSAFWNKVRDIMPWLATSPSRPREADVTGLSTLVPGTYDFHNVEACIMCGACVAACTSHEVSKGFLGPAALAKVDRFLEDPRESETAKRLRLKELDEPNGMWDCVRCNLCVQVCPKDVKPMDAIVRLRRGALERGLTSSGGARHIQGFVDLVKHEGRLNEAVMPFKVIGVDLKRLLHVLPLGLKMWLKGKVPTPFAQPIQGISHVRSIFASRPRRNIS